MVSRRAFKRLCILSISVVLLTILSFGFTPARSSFATNCNTTFCKAYNDWSGGQGGAYENLDTYHPAFAYCNTGCSWIEFGEWSKYDTNGTYIFLGLERTQYTTNYLWTYWSPTSGGINYHYLSSGTGGDTSANLQIQYNGSGYQSVHVIGNNGTNVSATTPAAYLDGNEIQTGFRMNASSGTSGVGAFTTATHQWYCRTCGYWVLQTSDGVPMSQGASTALGQAWVTPPHLPGSNGGTWQGYCYSPNCP